MEDQKPIKRILKTLNVLDYSANQDKVRSIIKQGIVKEQNHLETSLQLLNHFGKKSSELPTISRQVCSLMQLYQPENPTPC